ncbi:unnamed protein product [Polarella glacialis]|uniref:Uncharacterized protein n=1 Tax=Polarella glacialis TaxID=89957 RepID=A0A813GUD0_POLGL|nr:unnamed protein product [Polarella glacialis]
MSATSREGLGKVSVFDPQSTANRAWNCGRCQRNGRSALGAPQAAALQTARQPAIQNLTNAAWALASLGTTDSGPAPGVTAAESAPRLHESDSQHPGNAARGSTTAQALER